MSVTASLAEINVREELEANKPKKRQILETFWFTGVTAQTAFIIPSGWKPKVVYEAGSLQKEGSQYTLSLDVDVYSVNFSVAPANGNDIAVLAEIWL